MGGKMSSSRAYPLRYGGGIFLCCVGIGAALAAVTDLAKANLYLNVGFLVGTLGYFVTWRRAIARCGKPRVYQYLVIFAVIALEFGAFAVLAKAPWFQSLPPYTSQLVVLAVVAVHFMLMYWAFGVWVVRLGAAQLVLLAAAAVLSPPVAVVILGFGLVNIVFGAIMAIPILAKAPKPSGSNLPSN
jgi:hypothetical protein